MWWRIFVPSWRLFDRIGARPSLSILVDGSWLCITEKPKIRFYSLFFNPSYAFYHACNNLLERFLLELSELQNHQLRPDPTQLVSYQLVKDLAIDTAARKLIPTTKFRITNNDEEVLISPLYEVKQ